MFACDVNYRYEYWANQLKWKNAMLEQKRNYALRGKKKGKSRVFSINHPHSNFFCSILTHTCGHNDAKVILMILIWERQWFMVFVLFLSEIVGFFKARRFDKLFIARDIYFVVVVFCWTWNFFSSWYRKILKVLRNLCRSDPLPFFADYLIDEMEFYLPNI